MLCAHDDRESEQTRGRDREGKGEREIEKETKRERAEDDLWKLRGSKKINPRMPGIKGEKLSPDFCELSSDHYLN